MSSPTEGTGRWHKGSRFWRIGLVALLLAWATIPLVVFYAASDVGEAIGVFGLTSFTLLGGGAAHNFQQAREAVARAQTTGENDDGS